jgi:hyperosmotically inducible periplasmic protein
LERAAKSPRDGSGAKEGVMRHTAHYARFLIPLMLLSATAACSVANEQETAGEYVDSAAITTQVKTKLASEGGMDLFSQVKVTTVEDVVQLAGFVKTDADKAQAEQLAWTVKGVKDVENDIVVQP